MNAYKVNVINELQLIASVTLQDEYEKNVPFADVSAELVNGWFDDSFLPEKKLIREQFSDEEWDTLMAFHIFFNDRLNNLPDGYENLRESSTWIEIVNKANWAIEKLNWRNLDAKYDEI